MIFENNYPRIAGATDFADSAHLAGILALTDHPQQVDCRMYVNGQDYIRGPGDISYDDSRDAMVLLMCGLLVQGHKDLVRTDFIHGKDFLPPSVHGIESIAKTGSASWLQREDFELEISAKCITEGSMIGEPFQDMAKAIVYDELKMWTTENYLWDVAIYRYLCGGDCKWRNEPELCEWVISAIEKRIV